MTSISKDTIQSSDQQSWLGSEVVNTLFPFYFVFDRNLCVYQSGDSLRKIEPRLIKGASLNEFFKIKNPRIPLDYQKISSRSNSQHTWLLNESTSMRGQLVSIQDSELLIFMGSPWISNVDQLGELGLTASDFAKHDATLEHLFIQQAQLTHAADSERMIESLTKSAKAYKKLEKLQSELAFELNIAYDLKVRFSKKGTLVDIQTTVPLPYLNDVGEYIGRNIYQTLPFLSEPLSASIENVNDSDKPVAITFEVNIDESTRYFDARLTRDPDDIYLLLASDVTEEHLLKLQLERRANFDTITGLSNRAYFFEQITERSNRFVENTPVSALLIVDLDNFKTINDSYGHSAGDFALSEVANVLSNSVREGDVVARLGGDEFGIFAADIQDEQTVMTLAKRICKAVSNPIDYQDCVIHTGCSIGIAFSKTADITIDIFQQKADLAMYHAKSAGKGTVVVYQSGMYEQHRSKLQLRDDLETAIYNDQLSLAYQPVVINATGAPKGFEVLARWEHPKLGNIRPDIFITIAEECGLMVPLGRCLLRKAFKTWSEFKRLNTRANRWTLAINISAHQLYDKSLESDLLENLAKNNLQTSDIVLEITETALIRDITEAIKLISQLKNLGFAIALDDFGTGFSSLSYLDQLPLDVLKIDRSFINKINDENRQSPLVEAIVRLADVMQLDIVAEGIETSVQQAVLAKMGCRYAQGYYFSKPIPEHILMEDAANFNLSTKPYCLVKAS